MAIATIGAILERRVWIDTGSRLFPNLYVFLVGPAGIGKTRALDVATDLLREIPEFYLSPTSVSRASLVDSLLASKRSIVRMPGGVTEYHTMFVAVDELSAFMHKWDTDLVASLTKFYDCNPFSEAKRKDDLRIKMDAPQLSVCCGVTPSNLVEMVPPSAWGQGFMSRVILIYTTDRGFRNILDTAGIGKPDGLIHDLKIIGSSFGEIKWDKEYEAAFHSWREQGKKPAPTHPRLADYCSRRDAHVLKLSMIACLDQSGKLLLTKEHFQTALLWLGEAELTMGNIFSAGYTSVDARAMDEIVDFIQRQGKPTPQYKIIHFAAGLIPAHSVMKVIEIMTLSGRIQRVGEEKGHGLYEA